MKRIALWGYGVLGRKTAETVRNWWDGEIEIVRIYDLRYDEMKETSPEISDPDLIPADYAKGMFEAVLIAVNSIDQRHKMWKRLEKWGVPVFKLGREEDFFPGAAFRQREKSDLPRQKGYDVFAFADMFGMASNVPSRGIMYLFDASGKMLKDHWDTYLLPDYQTYQFDYPIRFEYPHRQTVSMPGEYCILAKQWSVNYWHFLFEGMDCVQLLEENGFSGRYVINDRNFTWDVLLLYGIAEDRILTVRDFEPGKVYSFETILYPKLRGNDRRYSAAVLSRLSTHMKDKLELDRERYPSRLYVERTGKRKLLNGRVFAEKNGFAVIDPGRLSIFEQMMYFYNADIVLSAHGANSANSLYMRPGTALIETFGRYWVNPCCTEALKENGIYFLPVCEVPLEPRTLEMMSGQWADYSVSETDLCRAVDEAARLVYVEKPALEETDGDPS